MHDSIRYNLMSDLNVPDMRNILWTRDGLRLDLERFHTFTDFYTTQFIVFHTDQMMVFAFFDQVYRISSHHTSIDTVFCCRIASALDKSKHICTGMYM